MPVQQGEHIEVAIEKPAAGGRMLARHEGQVILVQGGIPGERVRARIGRVERQLAFADAVEVLEPSADRREPGVDPACGGCLYAHIGYDRQRALKAEVVRDAFARLGRIAIDPPAGRRLLPNAAIACAPGSTCAAAASVSIARARTICATPPRPGRWMSGRSRPRPAAVEALTAAGCGVSAVELTENIAADERVLHVLPAEGADLSDRALDGALQAAGLTGCTGRSANGDTRTSGVPFVTDPLQVLTSGVAAGGGLQRHAESFFQANRYLLPGLVTAVIAAVPPDGSVLDLYAGVGLFSVCLAASGRTRLTAVEGDRTSGKDLTRNAAAYARHASRRRCQCRGLSDDATPEGGDHRRRSAAHRDVARGDAGDRRGRRADGSSMCRAIPRRWRGMPGGCWMAATS